MIKFTSVEKVRPEYAHWFIYGKMRSGKTRAAATFPRPLFIVPYQEGSHVSLMGMKGIDFVLVHGSIGEPQRVAAEPGTAYSLTSILADLEQRYAAAEKLWQKGTEEANIAADKLFPWETVVIESISHYTDLVQEELTRGNTLDMDRQKWGKLSAHLRSTHARLRSLPVHVVFIALSVEHFDGKGELRGGGPAFPGQMKYKLPSACECVVYMTHREGKGVGSYKAHFQTHQVFEAGCRYDELTKMGSMTPFSFAKVQKAIGADNE